MTTVQLINRIETLFTEEIDKKTGWGKIEIKTLFFACVRSAMKEYIDSKEKQIRENRKSIDSNDNRIISNEDYNPNSLDKR